MTSIYNCYRFFIESENIPSESVFLKEFQHVPIIIATCVVGFLFMRRLMVQGMNKIRIICRCLSHVSRRVGSDHNTLVCLTTPHVKPYRTYCLLLKVGPFPSNSVAEREGQGHSHLALHVRQAQTWRRLVLPLLARMLAIGNPDLPWAQEAALQQRWFGCSASVRDTVNCAVRKPPNQTSRTNNTQAAPCCSRGQSFDDDHKQISETSPPGWHKVGTRFGTRLAQG